MHGNTRPLLALSLIPRLGNHTILQILVHFPNLSRVFKASKSDLSKITGIGASHVKRIQQFQDWNLVDTILEKTEEADAEILNISEADYPSLLKMIYDPPILLWIKGNKKALSNVGLAIVGTRNPTPYGRKQAEYFSKSCTENQLTIFSGLAYGVDTIAHREAVKAQKETVAVLGSGIDWIYPSSNSNLAKQIIKYGGAIITEFPPGTKPDAGNFPLRNRIVSGLSKGTLVIETAEKGGSRITASLALDQGREVFVVPHHLDNPFGVGCNLLIKYGLGKLVQNFQDVLDEIEIPEISNSLDAQRIEHDSLQNRHIDLTELTEVQVEIVSFLQEGDQHVDDIAEKLDTSTQELLVHLLELECMEWVEQKTGKYFTLTQSQLQAC